MLTVLFIIILIIFILLVYMLYNKSNKRVVVFDMDETLGCFVQLGMFTTIIENHIHRTLTYDEFYILMDLYPLYQRPNIISILQYIKKKKQSGECDKVYIYTNNQGPKSWALLIKQYFESKLNYPLFDKVIHAYKVQGQHIEKNRTTHNKTVADFLKCTKLSKKTNICFLDDQYHPNMLNPNVYYLHLKPYSYNYNPTFLFQEFQRYFKLNDVYIQYLQQSDNTILLEYNLYLKQYSNNTNLSHEREISKKILSGLQYYFNHFNKTQTRKHNSNHNHTKKNHKKNHYKYIV